MADGHLTDTERKLKHIRREAEERDAARRAAASGIPYVDLRKIPISIEAVKLVPENIARRAGAAALEVRTREVAVAATHPLARETKDATDLLEARGYTVKLFTTSAAGLAEAWRLYRFVPAEAREITGKMEIGRVEELLRTLRSLEEVRQAIKKIDFRKLATTNLFEVVLAGALANRASDVHFEAAEGGARIRYRLDGILYDVYRPIPEKNYDSLMSRIKLLSGLKMNVRGEPQDGRFSVELTTKNVEVRVSIIPAEFGETAVMRVLDPDAIIDISSLGFRDDDMELVRREFEKPNGLILNTGPTGSGKTTTLYAFLKALVSSEIKIITIEDPIEYHLPAIEQTQVNTDVGYTFANGLRAILRQDPDVVLVGEIRDLETADIAMQASLTGHVVFSTLHANDAVGAVPRLVDLGVKTTTIGPAMNLLIAQRLVRRLCEKCSAPADTAAAYRERIERFLERLPPRIDRSRYEGSSRAIRRAAGCAACSNLGYAGRVGIFELLPNTTKLQEVMLKDPSDVSIRRYAESEHMVTMQDDGVLKILGGMTTIEEVEQATGPIAWLRKNP